VAEWLATSDLCVFPSEREGMPVCLMEALCMGVPVVTSDSRGCRDVVRNGLDGIVLASPDTEGLVNAIGSLLEHPELLEGMRRESLRQRSHFDRRCYIEEQLKYLELSVN